MLKLPGQDSAPEVMPPPNGDVSLSEYAYNRIMEMLLGGQLSAGEVLQERKLGETLSISRTPVREALTRLEAESLVSRRHGRVLVVSDTGIETYVNLLDMRRILEVEAAGRATGRITQEEAESIIGEIEDLRAAGKVSKVSPAQHWAVDDLVHGTIAEAAGNPLVASTVRDLRRRTHIFSTARIPHRLPSGASEHIGLLKAVAGNDAEHSRRLMGEHLDNVKNAIIEYILGVRRS